MDAVSMSAWLRAEIAPLAETLQPALPDASTPLCDYLRDGRALCLLTSALTTPAAKEGDENQLQDDAAAVNALPKNLQRSLHQVTTFHALERIQYFIKWCRGEAALDAYLVFSSVQLLDEQNEKIVCTCLNALRNKYRPHLNSKASGLWVKRSAHQLLATATPKPVETAAPKPDEVKKEETTNQSNNDESAQQDSAPTTTAPQSTLSSRLNAFLSKFPSETNVLAASPVAVDVTTPFSVEPVEDNEDDEDNNEEEVVETYRDDDDADDEATNEVQQVGEPIASGFSPRSSIGSSVSFSFTSERNHESFSEEQSFSSVVSSPPTSPKAAASRLRIPSIFEKQGESSTSPPVAAATPDRTSATSATSSTKEETSTPRQVSKLNIPAAFARHSSSTSVTSHVSETIETTTTVAEAVSATATTVETTVEVAEAATPKPVSKLNIPAAFARSTSTSSSSSEKTLIAKSEVSSASPSTPIAKKPSRLKIPSAFASGSPSPAATVEVAHVVAESRSPLAAFVKSPSATESTTSPSGSPSTSSTSSAKASSKLAAFLSTVEVVNAFVAEPAKEEEAATTKDDKQERFSDDESDSDESVDADNTVHSEEVAFDEPAVEVGSLRFSLSHENAIGLPSDDLAPHDDDESATNEGAERASFISDKGEHVEAHNIDHHDHGDSEQPFFVVEEVSLSKPATSTKLYAFLNAVDSTEAHRFSHTSSNGEDKPVERAGSVRSATSGHRKSVEETTTSEVHSERSPSNSVSSVTQTASSEVILEKERLSGENLALQQKLKAAESRLSMKNNEFVSLQSELATLKKQLAAVGNGHFSPKPKSAAFEAQVAELKAAHLKTIKTAQASREQFVREKKLLEAQVKSLKLQNKSISTAFEARIKETQAAHIKTIKTAQATRELFMNQTKRLEAQLKSVSQTQHSQTHVEVRSVVAKTSSSVAVAALESRIKEAKASHLKTIKAAQASRELLLSETKRLEAQLNGGVQSGAKPSSAAAAFEARIKEAQAAHLKTIKVAQASRELYLNEKKLLEAQLEFSTPENYSQDHGSRIAELMVQNEELQHQLQLAKDSEQAARYSAQMAFAAIDEVQERLRSEQAQRVK